MRGRELLTGCGIGCLGLLVAGVVSCVGFRMWLDAPADELEAERLLGGDTTGFVELRLSLDDPGTARFVEEALEGMGPSEVVELPGWARALFEVQERRRARQVRELFPMVVAWTLTPELSSEGDQHLLSLSAGRIGNRLTLARWILSFALRRSREGQVLEYRGATLIRLPPTEEGSEEITLVLGRGQLHVASAPAAVERAVDRMLDGDLVDDGPPSEIEGWFAALPVEPPLRGAISNQRGELVRLYRRLSEAPVEDRSSWPLDELRGLTVVGSFGEGSSLEGRLELLCPDDRWAQAHAGDVADLIEGLPSPVRLEVAGEPQVAGDRIRLAIVVADLAPAFRDD